MTEAGDTPWAGYWNKDTGKQDKPLGCTQGKKQMPGRVVVALALNPNTQEGEAGGPPSLGQPGVPSEI